MIHQELLVAQQEPIRIGPGYEEETKKQKRAGIHKTMDRHRQEVPLKQPCMKHWSWDVHAYIIPGGNISPPFQKKMDAFSVAQLCSNV